MKLQDVLTIPGIKRIKRRSWNPSSTEIEIADGGRLVMHGEKLQWTQDQLTADDWTPIDPAIDEFDTQLENDAGEFYVLTIGGQFRYLLRGPKGHCLREEMAKYGYKCLDWSDLLLQFVAHLVNEEGFSVIDYKEAKL